MTRPEDIATTGDSSVTAPLIPLDRLGDARSILAIRLDTIGDVVMTAPALASLSAYGARVTLLTSSVAAPVAPLLTGVHDVVALDVPWMKPAETTRPRPSEHRAALERLRVRNFDAAVVFTVSTQDPLCASYLAYQCDVPRIAAHSGSPKLYGLATDPVPETDTWPPARHEVDRQLDLVRHLGFTADGGPGIALAGVSARVARLVRSLRGVPWCLVHPGASAQSRRYPERLWAEVIDRLAEHGVVSVLAGSKADRERVRAIARGCRSAPVRVDGRLDLPELAALISAAPVAATCNSAASHLAAALGTRVVTLYAGTNPQHGPYSRDAVVLRAETPCTWCLSSVCRLGEPRCLTGITPDRVANAVMLSFAGVRTASAAV